MKWLRLKPKKLSAAESSQEVAVSTVESMLRPFTLSKNKYEAYQDFVRSDPELRQAIERLALLTAHAYCGPYVKVGKTLSANENILQENAQNAAYELDFRSRFFSIAKHLLTNGDYIYVVHLNNGVQQIQPLPMSKTSIVGRDQIAVADAQIQSADIYVLNEFDVQKRQEFPGDNQKIFHFSIDSEAEEVYDIYNRWTFGIYSISPIESLKDRLLWKKAILITDVLWRYRNVPREVHELDTSMFTPEKFAGATWEEQISAATKACQTYLKNYAKQISRKKVDQGFVVGSNVKRIYYVEPEKTTYSAPNDLINQINDSIREGIGAYNIGRGTYATELVLASYVVLMPNYLAYRIKRHLLELLRLHLKYKYNTPNSELNKLDIRLSLTLDILKGELIRQMAVAAGTETHTRDELRDMVGKDPLTEEQKKEVVLFQTRGRSSPLQTLADIEATAIRQTEPSEPLTPQSRRDKQQT